MSARIFAVLLFGMTGFIVYGQSQLCSSNSNTANDQPGWVYEFRIYNADTSFLHTSGQSHYSDFTEDTNGNPSIFAELTAGETYNMEVKMQVNLTAYTFRRYMLRIYIDSNQDNQIVHPDERVYVNDFLLPDQLGNTYYPTWSGTFTVPNCTLSGVTHIRVLVQRDEVPILCGTYDHGETEDYLINVASPHTVTSTDRSLYLLENTPYTFEGRYFSFFRTGGDPFWGIQIHNLPNRGTLSLGGVPLVSNQMIPEADIPSLTYTPPPNEFGESYTSFTFSVSADNCRNDRSDEYNFVLHVDPMDNIASGQSGLCASGSNSTLNPLEWVDELRIYNADTSFVHTSGQSHYSDFTQDADGNPFVFAELNAGETYNIEISSHILGGPRTQRARLYIDIDRNNQLVHPDERLFVDNDLNEYDSSLLVGEFTVPACVRPGLIQARLFLQPNSSPVFCGTYDHGETQDYLFTITNPYSSPTSANTSLQLSEDLPYTFSSSDFPFNDANGQSLEEIQVHSLPIKGTLSVSSTPLVLNQIVSADDFSSFVYQSLLNEFGDDYSSFTFSVGDCRGAHSTTHSLSFDVDPIEDPLQLVSPFYDSIVELPDVLTVAGQLQVDDPEATGFLFEITEEAPVGALSIDSLTGALTVLDQNAFHYSLRESVSVTIQTTSYPTGEQLTQEFIIYIIDREFATTLSYDKTFTKEALQEGRGMSSIVASDLDNEDFIFRITGGNVDQALRIDSLTGNIYSNNPAALHSEINPSINFTVSTYKTTTGENTAIKNFSLQVLRPTWNGNSNRDYGASWRWNIKAVPNDTTDHIVIPSGYAKVKNDKHIRTLELRNGYLLIVGGRLIIEEEYLIQNNSFCVLNSSTGAKLEVRGAMRKAGGSSLTSTSSAKMVFGGQCKPILDNTNP